MVYITWIEIKSIGKFLNYQLVLHLLEAKARWSGVPGNKQYVQDFLF